jgi:hypothetical protein
MTACETPVRLRPLGSPLPLAVAGWVGIALAVLALYAATALLLEATGASPPPIGRPHPVAEPPGVRPNL